jgi:hypothetical protein
MNYSPVALFCYNRPEHTEKTLNFLSKNEEAKNTDLFIFSDGPKIPEHLNAIFATRQIIKKFEGNFKSLKIIERSVNIGLAGSIIGGVTEIIEKYGVVIVLEDDLETSPFFLKFMNQALDKYKNTDNVMHISGYTYPCDKNKIKDEAFFLRIPMCWGWATWERAWKNFSKDSLLEANLNKDIVSYINFSDTYNYYIQYEQNKSKKINTWFIYWYITLVSNRGMALFPRDSLVNNIGTDASGTHRVRSDSYKVELAKKIPSLEFLRNEIIEEDYAAFCAHKDYFSSLNKKTSFRKIISSVKRVFYGN